MQALKLSLTPNGRGGEGGRMRRLLAHDASLCTGYRSRGQCSAAPSLARTSILRMNALTHLTEVSRQKSRRRLHHFCS